VRHASRADLVEFQVEVLFLGSGCPVRWQVVGVYLIRRLRLQAGVGAHRDVEPDVFCHSIPRLTDRVVGVQVDLLLFDGLPNTLDEDIAASGSAAVHADSDFISLQPPGEGFAGELRALNGVEDFRFFILRKGFFQRLDKEGNVRGDGHAPS